MTKLTIWIGVLAASVLISCLAQDNGMALTEPATGTLATGGEGEREEPSTNKTTDATTSPSVEDNDPLCHKLTEALATINKEEAVCMLNSVCNGLVCNYTAFSMKLWVLPCAHPPAVRMAIIDNQNQRMTLFDDVVMETARIQGQNYSIDVKFNHQGQFGLEISDAGAESLGNLFPHTIFSTDPSQCFETVCETITAAITDSKSNDTTCSPTSRCDGAVCLFTDGIKITMTAKIVECHNPPAVQLIIDNPFSEKDRDLVNGLFTTTSKVNVFGYEILVTVHQLGGGIGVEIAGGSEEEEELEEEGTFPPFSGEGSGLTLFSELPDFPTDFLPFPTDFPGEEDENDSTSSGGLLEYRFFPIDQNKPECETFSLTCLGLQGVVDKAARSSITCQLNKKCDTVNCFVDVFQNGAQFPLSMKFNPCKEPRPSVNLVLRNPDTDRIVLRREVDKSVAISVLEHNIEVTVDHIPVEDEKPYPSIGFAIDLMPPPEDGIEDPINVVRYTEVPVFCDHSSEASHLSSFTISSTLLVLAIAAIVNF